MKITRIINYAQEINPVRRYRGLKNHYLQALKKGEEDICKTLDIPEKMYLKYKKNKKAISFSDRIKIFIYQLHVDKHFTLLNTSFGGDKKTEAFAAALMQAKKKAAESVLHKTIPYRVYDVIDKIDTGTAANIKKAVFIPVNYLRYIIKSDKKFKPLMAQLTAIKGNGDDFAQQAYEIIIKHLKIKDRAPQLIIDNNLKPLGEYSSTDNTIKIRTNRKRKDIIRTLRHELEHFRQSDIIIRALGIEEYAKIYPQVKIYTLRKNFSGSINAPKIKPDKKLMNFLKYCVEGKKAYKQKDTWFDYYLNFIEVGARERGKFYQKQFHLKDNLTFSA